MGLAPAPAALGTWNVGQTPAVRPGAGPEWTIVEAVAKPRSRRRPGSAGAGAAETGSGCAKRRRRDRCPPRADGPGVSAPRVSPVGPHRFGAVLPVRTAASKRAGGSPLPVAPTRAPSTLRHLAVAAGGRNEPHPAPPAAWRTPGRALPPRREAGVARRARGLHLYTSAHSHPGAELAASLRTSPAGRQRPPVRAREPTIDESTNRAAAAPAPGRGEPSAGATPSAEGSGTPRGSSRRGEPARAARTAAGRERRIRGRNRRAPPDRGRRRAGAGAGPAARSLSRDRPLLPRSARRVRRGVRPPAGERCRRGVRPDR